MVRLCATCSLPFLHRGRRRPELHLPPPGPLPVLLPWSSTGSSKRAAALTSDLRCPATSSHLAAAACPLLRAITGAVRSASSRAPSATVPGELIATPFHGLFLFAISGSGDHRGVGAASTNLLCLIRPGTPLHVASAPIGSTRAEGYDAHYRLIYNFA